MNIQTKHNGGSETYKKIGRNTKVRDLIAVDHIALQGN